MKKTPQRNLYEHSITGLKFRDLPDKPGFWIDTYENKMVQKPESLFYALPAGPGRYIGPVVLPDRYNSVPVARGDALEIPSFMPAGSTLIIAHGCNAEGKWGAGISGELSRKYPEAEVRYRKWHMGQIEGAPPMELGRVQMAPCGEHGNNVSVYVANMIVQPHVIGFKGEVVCDLEAYSQCVDRLAELAESANATRVQMPKIGCGLGGADWETQIKPRTARLCARGIPLAVYER